MTATTGTSFVPMRVSKVSALSLAEEEHVSHYAVLDEPAGDRHLLIMIGGPEAFGLAASLGGVAWRRPMTYEFTAALVRALGGRVREVRLDRVLDGAYAATVEVEGPAGVAQVDARSSDALNLAVLFDAPVLVGPEMLADNARLLEAGSAQAASMRLALTADPMTIRRAAE